MNAKCEIESDLENFGARTTEFGVVVENIWGFEVSRLFRNFSVARGLSKIIFQILGA
jgi:hypothetical protein